MATQKRAVRGALKNTLPSSANTLTSITSADAAGAGEGGEPQTPYSQALSRLSPLQPVLSGLAHRNHNQHRRAAWWRHFGMLRRHCARFVDVLVSAVAAARENAAKAAKAAAKAKSKKRRREELASGGKLTPTGEMDGLGVVGTGKTDFEMDVDVDTHAAWLRDVLVPKCYLAFSQLTADNQFAPLGVVLLSILSQVQAACDCVSPRPASPPLSVLATTEPEPTSIESTATSSGPRDAVVLPPVPGIQADRSKPSSGVKEVSGGGVRGKAISREAVERAADLRMKAKAAESGKTKPDDIKSTGSPAPPKTAKTISSTSSSKRQELSAPVDREGAARPAKRMKAALIPKEREKGKSKDIDDDSKDKDRDKKRKKKAKKGDEFDDLFKGLF
ncbi:hypothetical protein GGR51DRAFT_519854 [Nemania sp. FL0031]|nr:hypothetical protein GGR51DRAFT_519854 [Nemania sp. FL0031]